VRELTIAAVRVEAVRGPTGRFPYPVQWQVVPLNVYREPAEAPGEPDPAQTVEALYVRITTRQGPEGLYGPVDPAAAWPLTQILAPFLVGQDALAGATLWDKMQRLDRHSRHGHLKLAIGAADNALWDLRGRAFDAPVWQLLGGSGRASVPAYVSTLGAPHDTSSVRALARELAEAGFSGQKWFPAHGPGSGAAGLRANITLAETVRDAVGPDVPVMFDAFMSWDLPYAISWCQQVAAIRPAWLEEPFAPAQVDAFAALRDKTTIPLAAGEHLYDRQDVLPFLSQRLLTVVQADPEWCGGVTELTRITALAETFGVPVIPHGHGLHAAIHVVASQSPGTCPMTEYLYRIAPGRHRFEAAPPEPADGAFPLPRRPGFGIELNDGAITSRGPWDGRLQEPPGQAAHPGRWGWAVTAYRCRWPTHQASKWSGSHRPRWGLQHRDGSGAHRPRKWVVGEPPTHVGSGSGERAGGAGGGLAEGGDGGDDQVPEAGGVQGDGDLSIGLAAGDVMQVGYGGAAGQGAGELYGDVRFNRGDDGWVDDAGHRDRVVQWGRLEAEYLAVAGGEEAEQVDADPG
jgi:L-rhamnonate dehydratase